MTNWWETAPLAEKASGNWWDAAPLVNESTVQKTAADIQGAVPRQPETFKSGPSTGGTQQPVSKTDPARLDRFLNGVYKGYAGTEQLMARALPYSPIGAVANAVSPGTGDRWSKQWSGAADERAKMLEEEGGALAKGAGVKPDSIDWWNVAGQVASPVNYVGAEGAGAIAGPLMREGAPLANALIRGPIQGATISAAQPVVLKPGETFGGQKAQQVGIGAATGGVADLGLSSIAKTVGPWASDKARMLIDKGVPLTIGETLGGAAKYTEDALTSTPFLGTMIKRAQDRSREGFNRATLDEVLSPIGEKVSTSTPMGRVAIKEASEKISSAYDTIVPQMSGNFDRQLMQDVGAIRQTVPKEKLAAFDDAWNRTVLARTGQRGDLSGKALQAAESDLRREASGLMKSQGSSFYDKELGAKLYDVHDAMTSMMGRYNPPELVQAFGNTNLAFAKMARVERAAGSVAAEDGIITPAQLAQATHVMDQSARRNAVAKGEALMQDFADKSKSVMTRKVPDSGTAGRVMAGTLVHGGTGGMFVPSELAASLAYTQPMQAALRSMAAGGASTRQKLANALLKTAPAADTTAVVAEGEKARQDKLRKLRQALQGAR